MLTKSTILKFYKQVLIQQAMIEHAENKEIGTRYTDPSGKDYFGKRPDILAYPRDILELALQGVTSFHASEEIWQNPLSLGSLIKKEVDELRIGWDLVLDVDCPDWEISKITTYLFIKALQDNYVKDITCKFSGNKGFHIGVPFEAFPAEIGGIKTKDRFPEGPKKIALYLLHFITQNYITINDNNIIFEGNSEDKCTFTLPQLKEKFGDRDFIVNKCSNCNSKIKLKENELPEFICPKCDQKTKSDRDFVTCEKCKILMEKIEAKHSLCPCSSNKYFSSFDPLSILEIDTVLISSRHLYRMPYSLHEKSGLVSLPINPNEVLNFEKSMADPAKIIVPLHPFLDRNISGESAKRLLIRALDFEVKNTEVERTKKERKKETEKSYEDMILTSPIKEEFFPSCMQQILKGLVDGKKRALFCLINFLGKIGWSKPEIENLVYEWNKKNPEPLREVYIKGQLSSFNPGEKLPPNCDNESYYSGIGIKCESCRKFKNPVNYTLWRWRRHLEDNEAPNNKVVGKLNKKSKEKEHKVDNDKIDNENNRNKDDSENKKDLY